MFLYAYSQWAYSPYAISEKKYFTRSTFTEVVTMRGEASISQPRCIDLPRSTNSGWDGFEGITPIFWEYSGNDPTRTYIWTNNNGETGTGTNNIYSYALIKTTAFKASECKLCNYFDNAMRAAKDAAYNMAKKWRKSSTTPTITDLNSAIGSLRKMETLPNNKYVVLSEVVPIATSSCIGNASFNLNFNNSSSGTEIVFTLPKYNNSSYVGQEFYISNIILDFSMSFWTETGADENEIALYKSDYEWLMENAFNGSSGGSYTYTYTYSYSYGGDVGNGTLRFWVDENKCILYANDAITNKLDPLLRNYIGGSSTNQLFHDGNIVLPTFFTPHDSQYSLNIAKLLWYVCLYHLRQLDSTNYAANDPYNNEYYNGGNASDETTGLPGCPINLRFKRNDCTKSVNFCFQLESFNIGIKAFKKLYLELTPIQISGSGDPYTISNWGIVPARFVRLFTDNTSTMITAYTNTIKWHGDNGADSYSFVKPAISLLYNDNDIVDLTPITDNYYHQESITLNGLGPLNVLVYLYKPPHITVS